MEASHDSCCQSQMFESSCMLLSFQYFQIRLAWQCIVHMVRTFEIQFDFHPLAVKSFSRFFGFLLPRILTRLVTQLGSLFLFLLVFYEFELNSPFFSLQFSLAIVSVCIYVVLLSALIKYRFLSHHFLLLLLSLFFCASCVRHFFCILSHVDIKCSSTVYKLSFSLFTQLKPLNELNYFMWCLNRTFTALITYLSPRVTRCTTAPCSSLWLHFCQVHSAEMPAYLVTRHMSSLSSKQNFTFFTMTDCCT